MARRRAGCARCSRPSRPRPSIAWAEGLGQPTFVGSSGRVFPKAMKASPLLRAWLARLAAQGVTIRTARDWLGWDEAEALLFGSGRRRRAVPAPDAVVLALGGASWPTAGLGRRLGGTLREAGRGARPVPALQRRLHVAWSAALPRPLRRRSR